MKVPERKGQFIAGARCPKCRLVDRLVVQEGPHGKTQHCVACGFSLTQSDSNASITVRNLPTNDHDETDI